MQRPHAWEGILLVFIVLLLLLGINLALGVIWTFAPDIPLSPFLIVGELLILGVALAWAALRRLPRQATFYLYKPSWLLIGLSLLVALTWWPLAIGLATLVEQLFSLIGPPPEIPPPRSPADAVGYFITIVILAPLCEEPVFRGFIMRGWLRYGFGAGVIGSGVLFGLQHGQLSGLIPLSLMGAMLGIVVLRANSLWPGVLIHAVYNGLSVPFIIAPQALPDISDNTFIIVGLLALPAALYSLWLYHRMAPPSPPAPRQEPNTGHNIANLIALLLVMGLFSLMALMELFIRLNPELGGVQ